MARWLDLMLCIFPFEAALYNKSGLRTIFVGHPMGERLEPQRIETKRDPDLVALLPGSRRREIRKILPIMLEAAQELRRAKPQLRFEIAAASPDSALQIEEILKGWPNEREIPLIKTGSSASTMQRAAAGMVASGSATLEATYFRLPFVLIYKVSWVTYLAGRLVIRVDFLGMPNVLANRAVVPEFIQQNAKPEAVAHAIGRLLDDASARAQMTESFDQIISSLGQGGASRRAAAAIMEELKVTPR
jgi:lipid-A-disaccharide synthase